MRLAGSGGFGRPFQGLPALAGRLGRILLGGLRGLLADRIYKGGELIAARSPRTALHVQAHKLPSQRSREAGRVVRTEVVAVRLRIGCQRAKHRGGIGIYIGQGSDGRMAAG